MNFLRSYILSSGLTAVKPVRPLASVRPGEGKRSRRPTSIPRDFVPASINRHTGEPHEHLREIERRQRQSARAVAKE